MSYFNPYGKLERGLPFVLLANIIPWCFGLIIWLLSRDQHFDAIDVYFALACLAYLPAGLAGSAVLFMTKLPERVIRGLTRFLMIWGMLTVALFAAWIITKMVSE